jgi:hypothetical protein
VFWPDKYGVIWSAKSASVVVVLWFLSQLGLLEAARFYHGWPHEFRKRVLYESLVYQMWLEQCDIQSLTWHRIIRDPYKRAVSAYRHALRWKYEDAKMSNVLGRAIEGDRCGFSFSEFLNYLASVDIESCNLHHRQQYHPLEHELDVHVINADKGNLLEALGEIGTQRMAPHALAFEIGRVNSSRVADRVSVGLDCSERAFTSSETRDKWPDYDAFLSSSIRTKIERIYWKDFQAYSNYL